jgi:glyoxylase-like metal-dependent hydrolase (beta-lactamase superfamily II)
MKIKLGLGYAGYCFSKANHVVKGDSSDQIKFHALFGLLHHPDKGWILFDTGYTTRFYDATKTYPNKIYADATKVVVCQENEIKAQLHTLGLKTSDVKHIIISHFHADHIGGMKDFNDAVFYCTKSAYLNLTNTSDFLAFSKGILKDLLPENLADRIIFIEDFSSAISDVIFGVKFDLFNDGSILVYNLPGHAAGQIGIELKTKKGTYFLVADSCWDKRAYQQAMLPNPIVRLFFDSWKDYKESLAKLSRYHDQFPEVLIVPTHCSKTTHNMVFKQINMDVL